MAMNQSIVRYYSSRKCAVCGDPDFDRYDFGEHKVVQKGRLKEIELRDSGLVMAVCNSHYEHRQRAFI